MEGVPADLAALLQGQPGGFGILLAQQLLGARLLGSSAALAAPALLTLHACRSHIPLTTAVTDQTFPSQYHTPQLHQTACQALCM